MFDENLFQTISEMRSHSFLGKHQDLQAMQPFMVATLQLQQATAGIVACHTDFDLSHDQSHVVSEAGAAWFWELVGIETQELRSYAPAKCVLWQSISTLGEAFLKFDPPQISRILVAILQDEGKTELLGPLFRPSANIGDTLRLYRMVWQAMQRGMSWSRLVDLYTKIRFSGVAGRLQSLTFRSD